MSPSNSRLRLKSFWQSGFSLFMFSALWTFPQSSWGQSLTFIAGGDVAWPTLFEFPSFDRNFTFHTVPLKNQIKDPFQCISATLQSADLAFVNLEHPIATQAKLQTLPWAPTFLAHPPLAAQLAKAGIDIASTANNHALDAGVKGLQETREYLSVSNIKTAGTGNRLHQARKPIMMTQHKIRFALLAYTEPENSLIGYATPTQPGVAPLNRDNIIADIKAVSSQSDVIIVSLHWGTTGQQHPTHAMRSLAHQILESGGDMIIGHHPHVVQGIELYQGKPILYSLGNLIFPYTRPGWSDNMLVQATLNSQGVTALEVLPITGRNPTQPCLLKGDRAQAFLQKLKDQSAALKTNLEIQGDRGYITIPQTLEAETGSPPFAKRGKTDRSPDKAVFDAPSDHQAH